MVASSPLRWLDPNDVEAPFPDVEHALKDPNGLLAIGGDLSPARLLRAYRHGIFPWYSDDQPILWWSPDPRTVLYPEHLKVSRSLRRTLKKKIFAVTADSAFRRVIECCAEPRVDGGGTWLTGEMIEAYCRLHTMGHAHSIETWYQGKLVGGLYGLSLGKVFFGESMFSRRSDASKVAFVHLVEHLQTWGYELIDCQVASAHLSSLGAEAIPRRDFIAVLNRYCDVPNPWKAWVAANG
jgi:leucyl/phenylalanyl-tRNA--protein transferase